MGLRVHKTMPFVSSGQSKMVFSDKVSELEVHFSASQTGQVDSRILLSLPQMLKLQAYTVTGVRGSNSGPQALMLA